MGHGGAIPGFCLKLQWTILGHHTGRCTLLSFALNPSDFPTLFASVRGRTKRVFGSTSIELSWALNTKGSRSYGFGECWGEPGVPWNSIDVNMKMIVLVCGNALDKRRVKH